MSEHPSLNSALESSQALVLLVSDVLDATPASQITDEGRLILVQALRRSLHSDVSIKDEKAVFDAVLDAGMEVTKPFDPAMYRDVKA